MTSAGNGEISVGALTMRFVVEAEDSNGANTVFEVLVPAGARVPAPHSHDAFEEFIYGLMGVTTWTVEGKEQEIGPGQALSIAPGRIHGFVNSSESEAKFLAIATPGVFGPDFFHEMGAVMDTSDGGPPDRERIFEVMRRHGLTPALPQEPA